jgi:hypothetical protein
VVEIKERLDIVVVTKKMMIKRTKLKKNIEKQINEIIRIRKTGNA